MTKTNLTALIDAFGQLKAQQDALEAQEKALKAALADLEPGKYQSDTYELNIIASSRETADKELAAKIKAATEAFKATLSRQYLAAHTNETAIRTHKVAVLNKVAA
jgi:uncharacterized protein (DUF3084 family)